MANLVCDIVTPAEQQFSEECYMVAVPGVDGHMGFMPGHAPLMSTLADGEVRVFSDANTLAHRFACQGGYVQVTGEKVIVLTDRALAAEDSVERATLEYDLKWYRTLEAVAAG